MTTLLVSLVTSWLVTSETKTPVFSCTRRNQQAFKKKKNSMCDRVAYTITYFFLSRLKNTNYVKLYLFTNRFE